ncbi:hypothetical protein LPW11_16870 [Geomonas sp. RF6]|uniref:hypothetical protein n=1 Tax=Geomonas sp. RF6 TaxID=2897342 RepID=UPI001E4F1CB1|nr:hypothetical protein [Geomonas sp. RF6]UFS69560.1 hypothetical protein LPW11_16870 [Geomonas sp. RF6]
MQRDSSPLKTAEILDIYFLENRARLLEIAAFLDRIDRAPDAAEKGRDFRYRSFVRALSIVLEEKGERTKGVQISLSDDSSEPLESAAGLKAIGAWQGGGA